MTMSPPHRRTAASQIVASGRRLLLLRIAVKQRVEPTLAPKPPDANRVAVTGIAHRRLQAIPMNRARVRMGVAAIHVRSSTCVNQSHNHAPPASTAVIVAVLTVRRAPVGSIPAAEATPWAAGIRLVATANRGLTWQSGGKV